VSRSGRGAALTPDITLLTSEPTLVLPVSERDQILGSPNATDVLVEYGDYECPYCKAAHGVVKEVLRVMGDRLAFVFRHFPLSNVHPYAHQAAEAAEAAGAQGKFWPAHDLLFTQSPVLDMPHLLIYARELGLDVRRFVTELESGVHSRRVDEDFRSGILSGVNGTPTFFVNGVRHNGGYDLRSLLAAFD
jgi:protein-disulfide isomerase